MHDFRYVGNKLYCEGVAVETLARKFGTPLYIYSQRTLTNHFQKLDRAMAPVDHLICFAMKSNSNQSVLRTIANLGGGVSVVDGATNALIAIVPLGGAPWDVDVNPLTNRVYVSQRAGGVTVIDGATNAVIANLPIEGLWDVAVNPNTNRVYVTDRFGSGDRVLVIDGATNALIDAIFVPVGGDRSMAEMTREEKAAISHRGRAARRLASVLGSPSASV